MFFNSQTEPEQNHIISAFIFELSKVETKAVRERMVGQLANVDAAIAQRVADGLGMQGPIKPVADDRCGADGSGAVGCVEHREEDDAGHCRPSRLAA